MSIVPIRKAADASPAKVKAVEANQKSVDALPMNSGMWKVQGEAGLYVRCRAASKSFMLQRRIDRDLVKMTLKSRTVKAAKEEASRQWGALKQKPAADGVPTLGGAVEQYIEAKLASGGMGAKTALIGRYNLKKYLSGWKDRSLREIASDRLGIRQLQQQITKKHGKATSNQCVRLLAAVYRWHRDVDESLPEWPRKAAELHTIKARDWAYSPDDLRAWWHAAIKEDGKPDADKGVSTLSPLKRMWWLVALFTGARKGSIEAMRWPDVDLEKRVIRFRVTKGDRPYSVPMSDTLAGLLTHYQQSNEILPSDWLFPSPVIDGAHLVDVKNTNEGVGPAHRLRHTFRTTLAELGASRDQAKLLMGHSLGGDVSTGYISELLVVESLRPVTNKLAEHYLRILGPIAD
jgi:integrase